MILVAKSTMFLTIAVALIVGVVVLWKGPYPLSLFTAATCLCAAGTCCFSLWLMKAGVQPAAISVAQSNLRTAIFWVVVSGCVGAVVFLVRRLPLLH